MIARGFKSVAWVGAVGGAALGCYMISLNVAAERAELTKLERQIVMAKRDIRSLQTELGTRGRLQQLEQWNADVLALSAPAAAQFVEDEFRLASYTPQEKSFKEQAKVQLASAPGSVQQPRPTMAVAQTFDAQAEGNRISGAVVRRASLVMAEAPVPARAPELKKVPPKTAKPEAKPLVKLASAKAEAKPLMKAAPPNAKVLAPAKPVREASAKAVVIKAGVARPLASPAKATVKKATLASDSLVRDISAAAQAEKKGGGAGRR
jgi:hypothetical protein